MTGNDETRLVGDASPSNDAWEAHTESRADTVEPTAARSLHDLLDRDGDAPAAGDPLPPLWHWLAFRPQARQSNLGVDGHPRTGGFLPPADGRRRMYAGGKVAFDGELAVGERIDRTSDVTDVTVKQGRTGELLFVTVEHRLVAANPEASIEDRNDIVYRHPAPTPERGHGSTEVDADAIWGKDVAIDPALLFRFSALTYNAHRIHYDRHYATTDEGYPALVVHGPLQAILLADAVRDVAPSMTMTSFAFRSTAPAFDNHPLQLRVKNAQQPDRLDLAVYSDATLTMTATATLRSAA